MMRGRLYVNYEPNTYIKNSVHLLVIRFDTYVREEVLYRTLCLRARVISHDAAIIYSVVISPVWSTIISDTTSFPTFEVHAVSSITECGLHCHA